MKRDQMTQRMSTNSVMPGMATNNLERAGMDRNTAMFSVALNSSNIFCPSAELARINANVIEMASEWLATDRVELLSQPSKSRHETRGPSSWISEMFRLVLTGV